MTRAMFTVIGKDGRRYCANNLQTYDGRGGTQALAFICSGRLVTLPVDDVASVELSDGWSHCNACDNPVGNLSYSPDETPTQQA